MSKLKAAQPETDSRRATYQDVLDAPPHKVAEVVDGTLYIFDRPAVAHSIAMGKAVGGSVVTRAGGDKTPPDAAYFTLAPDWVCEVLSPSTRKLDLGGKSSVYARADVKYIWFVDPIARSLETKVLRGEKWVEIATLHDDATVSLPPFEAISFSLGDLWLPQTVHDTVPGELTDEPEAVPIAASK